MLIRVKRYCRSHPSVYSRSFRSITTLPVPRLDFREISDNIVRKSNNALNRKAILPSSAIRDIPRTYTEYKNLLSRLNAKRNARSILGEQIRKAASEGNLSAKQIALGEATKVKAEVLELEEKVAGVEQILLTLALAIPNDTHPESPLGPESAAVTLSAHGPECVPANTDRDHVAICKKLGLLDLESGSVVTGSSWYYLLNEAALLEMALTNYAVSIALKHGFTPVIPPDVVRSDIANRCGFQPRDHSGAASPHMYQIKSPEISASPELVLCGTSEIPLAGMFANKVFPSTTLPLKVVGLGHSFRAEAGARGADTRGLYRVHQFTKVELFAATTQDGSESMMNEMMEVQKAILEGLGLPFRQVLISVCDLLIIACSTECLTCHPRNSVLVHTGSTTWRRGCPDEVVGVKYPLSPTVRTINPGVSTYATELNHRRRSQKTRHLQHLPPFHSPTL
jgi:seryl-tRNA synthetase